MSAAVEDEANLGSSSSQRSGEFRIRLQERIVASDIDPDRNAVERLRAGEADQIVAREVFGIVKRARGRLGAAEPERSGMRADRTEALGSEPREVESPEAAHRDPADRNPALVGVRPPSAAGIASRSTDVPHFPSRRSCQ